MRSLAQATYRWDGNLECSFPYSKCLIERIKIHIPAYARTYEPTTKVWVVDEAYSLIALRLLRETYPDTIMVDNRHMNSEWKFSEAEPAVDPNFAVLYVMPTAPRCVVEAAYKALSKQFHPDRASVNDQDHAHEQMVRLNSAFEAVRDRVAS